MRLNDLNTTNVSMMYIPSNEERKLATQLALYQMVQHNAFRNMLLPRSTPVPSIHSDTRASS